jgi:hypothetical protein
LAEEGTIGAGAGLTETLLMEKQLPTVYVIVAVPAAIPVTRPPEDTVATRGALLLHMPPGVTSANDVVAPTQTDTGPAGVMAAVPTVIVTVSTAKQDPTVYVIGAMPAVIPVTSPPDDIVAIAGAPLLQVPPVVASVSVMVAPAHMEGS